MYEMHINRFADWCTTKKVTILTQEIINMYKIYLIEDIKYADNSLAQCMAALKYKLNRCEDNEFVFKKKRGPAKIVRPHTAFTVDKLEDLFKLAAGDPQVNAIVHLMYDTAARIQDVARLEIGKFDLKNWDKNSGMEFEFVAKKTSARKVYITKATLRLL